MQHSMTSPHLKAWVSAENFYRLVVIAIILRVAIMPFFAHVDVLSEARRIYFWHVQGIYFDDISRNATSLFQLIFFKITGLFLENKDMLFAHADMQNSTAHPIEYYEFVSQPTIFRTLFIIKLPFLVADLITAWAIYVYCGRSPGSKNAVLFWLFNPICIYAFYVFGRFESIPIMFTMLSLLALKRQNLLLASVMIGLAINSRELYIFLGPVFIAMVCSPSCREYSYLLRSSAVAIVAFALAISMQVMPIGAGDLDAFGREVSSIATEGRVDHLFQFILGSFLMFPMVIFVILMYAWNSDKELHQKALLLYGLVLMSFFCLSSHTSYYTSWMMMFPCIYLSLHNQYLKPLLMLCVTWTIYNLAITDLGVFTTWLASPWSINMSGLPNFPAMYRALGFENTLDLLTFSRIARTCYAACIIYLAYQMLRAYRAEEQKILVRDKS
ncbi:MAG: hypothetical protein KTR16_04880 [Acidiferrobacterales bacterium]|nr:hypothetical protein [Acidiferrobacterales bacterium]